MTTRNDDLMRNQVALLQLQVDLLNDWEGSRWIESVRERDPDSYRVAMTIHGQDHDFDHPGDAMVWIAEAMKAFVEANAPAGGYAA